MPKILAESKKSDFKAASKTARKAVKKTAQDLEAKLVALERRHYEAAGRAEDTKKDLERKHLDKVVENESLKKTVENLERKVRVRKTSAHRKLTFGFVFDAVTQQ